MSFDVQMGEWPHTSSCVSDPLSDIFQVGNGEMYYDASASWEVKRQDEECSDTVSLVGDSTRDNELC